MGVPDADSKKGSGGSDAFVRVSLHLADADDEVASAQTTVRRNTDNPDWSDEPPLRLQLEQGVKAGVALRLRAVLWDKDFSNEDDVLASATVAGLRGHSGSCRLHLLLKGEPGWPDVRASFEHLIMLPTA